MEKPNTQLVPIRVPLEIYDLWKFQAYIEDRSLENIIVDAMNIYIKNYLRKHGIDPDEIVIEEVSINELPSEGLDLLKQIGVDTQEI